MNTRIASILVAAALVAPFVSPSFAAPRRATGYPASKITVQTWNSMLERRDTFYIRAGTPRSAVVEQIGQPREKLSPDVWVYDNCDVDYWQARSQGCTLLVVTFTGTEVHDLKFVNAPMAAVIAADLKQHPVNQVAAR